MKPKKIASPTNSRVKEAVRLKRKRNRYSNSLFLAEGEDLLDAALTSGFAPRQVFLLQGLESLFERRIAGAGNRMSDSDVETYSCAEAVMERLSSLGSGSRVVGVFDFLDVSFPEAIKKGSCLPLVYVAGIRDPGNIGTLIRSAAALGANGFLLSPMSADPYSPKALRGSMGSIFNIPLFLGVEEQDVLDFAGRNSLEIVCADPASGIAVWDVDLSGGPVIILGSEREGIPVDLLEASSAKVRIPQEPGSESVNVGAAGSAILYEALRQRRRNVS